MAQHLPARSPGAPRADRGAAPELASPQVLGGADDRAALRLTRHPHRRAPRGRRRRLIDWILTDLDRTYRTELSNGALIHADAGYGSGPPRLTITLAKPQLIAIIAAGTNSTPSTTTATPASSPPSWACSTAWTTSSPSSHPDPRDQLRTKAPHPPGRPRSGPAGRIGKRGRPVPCRSAGVPVKLPGKWGRWSTRPHCQRRETENHHARKARYRRTRRSRSRGPRHHRRSDHPSQQHYHRHPRTSSDGNSACHGHHGNGQPSVTSLYASWPEIVVLPLVTANS